MVAVAAPDWLPSGWTVQVNVDGGRKVKQFCNVKSGVNFSSKKDVLQYVEQNASDSTPQTSSEQRKSSSKNTTPIVEKTSENPDWLPHGWITEVKIKGGSGKPYKVYIDPESGSKYYSKPEVSRYLESVKSGSLGQKKQETNSVIKFDIDNVIGGESSLKKDQKQRTDGSKNSLTKQEEINDVKPSVTTIVATESDELPPGWIKEIKTKKTASGMRKDSYYTDPVSGYVFSSKKDAFRYVETGSIGSCAVKPKKKERNDQELILAVKHNIDQSAKDKPSSSSPDESPNVRSTRRKNGIHMQGIVALGEPEPSSEDVVSEKDSPCELPPGWIKEVITKKCGNRSRKYMQYTDPLSGYMFTSKRDALRYSETGDIGSCAAKPRKRNTDDPELINGKISAIIHSLTGLESFLELDAPQNNGRTATSNTAASEQEEIDSTRAPIDKGVHESGSAIELPSEWIEETTTKKSANGKRSYKQYVEPSTGYVFRSKKDALRYVETGDINKCVIKPKKRERKNSELTNAVVPIDEEIDEGTVTNSRINEKSNEVPEWLPSGWTMELKTKNSATPKQYKCYIDPCTGRKFYSKPEVSRYLATVKTGSIALKDEEHVTVEVKENLTGGQSTSIPDSSQDLKPIDSKICSFEQTEVEVEKQLPNNITVERVSCDELPPGWMKEVRSSSIPDSSQDLKPIDSKICSFEQTEVEVEVEKHSPNNINVERVSCDELPPGWIKELRSSSIPDSSQDLKPIDSKICSFEQTEVEVEKQSPNNINVERVSCDELPPGWIKELRSSSIPDSSQDLKPIDSKICTFEQTEVEVEKQSPNNITVERVPCDELPPGWIKEVRSKKVIKGLRKDSYYINPQIGYKFRSLKDALRYVETGDVSQCASRPRKKVVNEPEPRDVNISLPAPVEAKESSNHTTTRIFSAGKESSGPEVHEGTELPNADGSNVTKESSESNTGGSKRKLDSDKSAENGPISTPAATKGSKRQQGTKVSAGKAYISTPTTELSKRKRDPEVSVETVTVPTTMDIVHKKLPENVIAGSVNRRTQTDPSKPKKKQALLMSTPTRTSKRLVGLQPDTPINLGFSAIVNGGAPHGAVKVLESVEPATPIYLGVCEVGTSGACQDATKVLVGEHITKRVVDLEPNLPTKLGLGEARTSGASHSATEVPEVEPEREITPHDYAEEMLSAELLNKIEKALQEHAAIVEKTVQDQAEKPLEVEAVTIEDLQQESLEENQAVTDELTEKPFEHQAVIYELIEKPLEDQAFTYELPKGSQENGATTNKPIEKPIEQKVVMVNQNVETPVPPGMQNPQDFYPVMDSWSDPCIEFAFKTLTGALPVEDNTGTDGYFQHQVEPASHNTDNVGLASYQGLPNYLQSPYSLNLNEPQRPMPRPGPMPMQQFPQNPTYMPSGSNDGEPQRRMPWPQPTHMQQIPQNPIYIQSGSNCSEPHRPRHWTTTIQQFPQNPSYMPSGSNDSEPQRPGCWPTPIQQFPQNPSYMPSGSNGGEPQRSRPGPGPGPTPVQQFYQNPTYMPSGSSGGITDQNPIWDDVKHRMWK